MSGKPGATSEQITLTDIDVEQRGHDNSYLENQIVQSLSWKNVTVVVPDRETKQPKEILSAINGEVAAGEMLAIMGPSGCGKTTLLNVLAQREASAKAKVSATVCINGQTPPDSAFRRLSSYVEADDALIGSLTVKETLSFAAKLSLSGVVTATERIRRVDELLQSFGLMNQANILIGTLVRKGISTGQKRRLSVAAQLISAPKILFLDEPTSGLDSAASYKVMSYVRNVAKKNKLIVIASIHQPATKTFELFDKLLLLSGGKTCYSGSIADVKPYFDKIGFEMPVQTNPADFVLDLTNIDFESDGDVAQGKIAQLQEAWASSSAALNEKSRIAAEYNSTSEPLTLASEPMHRRYMTATLILLHRSFIKSHRDVVVYGIRFGMYLGLAIMMGTVWLRLVPIQSNMQPFTNCIMFGSCFMSFMAVVYVPAFLEDRMVCIKERANGMYGTTAFLLSNFLIGLPYLFIIAFVSSTFTYWMTNFRPDGQAFMVWVMWMYLNLVAAESLVVLMSCLFPNFVGALALTAMANGIWMACDGFMVQLPALNPFYRYVFSYIDYQAYVFGGLVVNEFGYRIYKCAETPDGCWCQWDTPLKSQCLIEGVAVLNQYGYRLGETSKHVGITLGIILGMRLMGWAAMQWRK
ncbi:P-loop containing nucleoside triphosphate hydrolase protein [Hyaloscypha variabilis]